MHSSNEWLQWKASNKAVPVTLCLRVKVFSCLGPEPGVIDALPKPAHFGEEKAVQPEQKTEEEPFPCVIFSLERISLSKESMNESFVK